MIVDKVVLSTRIPIRGKSEGSTRLTYTGLRGGLEHLKIETIGIPVDKDDLINYQLRINYQLLIRTFTYQPTVDKTIVLSTNC